MLASTNTLLSGRENRRGFTIVELLIVIVVIGILAAITIVAYNGVQQRARDSRRSNDLEAIQKVLELYKIDNGGYPICGASGVYQVGTAGSVCPITSVSQIFTSKYLPASLQDPINTGSYVYQYATGFRNDASGGCGTYDQSQNYILGDRLEASTKPVYTCWSSTDLNYRGGTNN